MTPQRIQYLRAAKSRIRADVFYVMAALPPDMRKRLGQRFASILARSFKDEIALSSVLDRRAAWSRRGAWR